MATRTSTATWEGDLSSGRGTMSLGSGAWTGPFSFRSRMESGPGSNPEELIGAAHAGCFSMAFAAALGKAGHPPQKIETTADVQLEKVGEGFKITTIKLRTRGRVPGIDEATFREIAESAKRNCPVSQALAGTQISLDAALAR